MKYFIASVLLMCIVASVVGDDCNINGHTVKAGEKYIPEKDDCSVYTCNEDGSYSALTCPLTAAPGCKYIPQDLSKPYPECCESYDCKN